MCSNSVLLIALFCLVNMVGCGGKNIKYNGSQTSGITGANSEPDSVPDSGTDSQPTLDTPRGHDGFSEDNFESIVDAIDEWYYPSLSESSYPEGWKRRTASKDLQADYIGVKVTIRRGNYFFTYHNKVAIGWHGTYNPPSGM